MPLLAKVKDIFKGGSSAKKKKVYHNVKLDNPEESWEVIGELGDGAYGKVYKARRKDTEQLAALKQVLLEAEDDLDSFMVEIDILCECKHPNIVELLEAYHFDGKLWMYLEYCDGGAVDSIMLELDRPLTEPQIATVCQDLCNALIYIHSNKVIHRDLKAGNVLLTTEGGVKLADFGVSAKNKNTFDKRGTFIGTPYWLAPEVILCETFIDAKYDYKADIWSLGISLIEFAQMDPPNHEVSPVRVMLKIQKSDPPKLDYPSRWSKEFNDFIAKCLTKDPVLRPSAEDLLKHPFLRKRNDRKPIIDLLVEYNAEILEEVVEDGEDPDHCRLSTVSESFKSSTSKFDTESLISIDKDSTLQSNYDDKMASPTLDDRENGGAISNERRVSKGPAPLPPATGANSQPPPKKGPAPAVPIPQSTSSSSTISVTSVKSVSSDTVSSPTVVTSPVLPQTPVKTSVQGSSEVPSHVTSTPTTAVSERVPSGPHEMSPITVPDKTHGTPVLETEKKTSLDTSSPSDQVENSTVSIPARKSDSICDSDMLETGTVTVNNISSTESSVEVSTKESVIENDSKTMIERSESISKTQVVNSTEETQHSSMEEEHVIPVTDTPAIDHKGPADSSVAPVTLSVVPPVSGSDVSSHGSDVVLTSISSEGFVIVRNSTSSSNSNHQATPKSVVTYTVTGDSEPKSEWPDSLQHEAGIPQPIRVTTVPEDSIHVDLPVASKFNDSIAEAEAQAVMILESAIDSAMDTTASKKTEDLLGDDLSSSSISHGEVGEGKGEVIVVAMDDTSEADASGHKLDESEVLISTSSIPDEHKEQVQQPRFEISLEEQTSFETSPTTTRNDEAHVSVVEVAEGVVDSVTIVRDESKITSEVVVEGGETTQVSLTIEGTTLEDTDVDEVESSSPVATPSSDVPVPEAKVNSTSEKEVDPNATSGEPNVTTITSSPTPPTSPPALDRDLDSPTVTEENIPLKPLQNGIRRQNSRASDRSDSDTTSTIGSDKENRQLKEDNDFGEEVTLRNAVRKPSPRTTAKNLKNKELQESIALRKKTRKRTRKFVIDGVVVTTTTSKVIYGDDEEQGILSSAHLARKQELRQLKLVQKREQKQFQDLAIKANTVKLEQEKKFELEKLNLLRNYDSQIDNLIRQQKQLVEKAEARQESELKIESKKTRADQERELKAFRDSLKQEWKLLKQEVDLLPKDRRKEVFKVRKEQLEREQTEREKACLERLNDSHEMALKRLNDKHRKHIALKERQFLEEKHQLLRARESALWDMEERHIQDKHQLAKEQLKDIYFLQRLQMTIRHNVELEQVRRFNQQKVEDLLKRQQEERRQLPKRIRQEMKTREKMFREQIRISMSSLPSHDQEKEQLRKFHEQEKIKYDKERKRAEMKHKKQMEELQATIDASEKELVHLQNEKGKLLTEHETYKLKSLDEEYQRELKEWKSNLAPRKQKLEEDFDRQLREQEKFYGDSLTRGLGLCTPSHSTTSLTSSHH